MDVVALVARYFRTRRIAWVAGLCIAIAVAAMVVVTSVMAGFRERILFQVRGTEPDLSFRVRGAPPREHFAAVETALRGEMEAEGGVIAALSPRQETVGLVASRIDYGRGMTETIQNGVVVLGVDFARERTVIPFDRILAAVDEPALSVDEPVDDELLTQGGVPGLLVGSRLAHELRLAVRRAAGGFSTDEATIMSGRLVLDAEGKPAFEPSNLVFRVAAAFDSGRDDFDASRVFIDGRAFRRLRYGPTAARPDAQRVGARVSASVASELDAVAARLATAHPELEVRTWKDGNRSLIDALRIENRTMAVVLGFIVLLAVALVLGLLYMMVVEKTRDVGILRSMGFSRARIVATFMTYGLFLGVLGTAAGIGLGLVLATNLNGILDALGLEIFDRRVGYKFRDIPVLLETARTVAIALLTVVLSFVAGGVAAVKAATLDPVVCLRYE